MIDSSLNPGKIGIWTSLLDGISSKDARSTVAEMENMGFGAVWIPETAGRDPLVQSGLLLAATERIVVATGIANVYARDALTMANGARTLAEAFPNRFLLGVGVSHEPLVSGIRGHSWGKPIEYLHDYLLRMKEAPYWAYSPKEEAPICVGALGPKALKLAAELTCGAHPYNVTPEHTANAREIMGPKAFLAPMAAVIFETDPSKAREMGRNDISIYLDLPNYRNNLFRMGFDEKDLRDGGSDRLIDSLRPWGDIRAVSESIEKHLDAGADHVCVQVITQDGEMPTGHWRSLAESLL